MTLTLVGLWVVFLRPVSLGGPADYVIISGHSMEPTFRTGDVVFAFQQDSYAVGDIVVYRVPAGQSGAGDRVIHRIIGGSAVTASSSRATTRQASIRGGRRPRTSSVRHA